MKKWDFIKLIYSMPRHSNILIQDKEIDLILTWDSKTKSYIVNLFPEIEKNEETNIDK